MNIFRELNDIKGLKNPVVTVGSFDGVHIGHKVIIDRLNALAKEVNGESTLITFYPHPRKVLYPNTSGKELLMINSQLEKIELLKRAKLDNLIILDFSLEFSKTSSIDFIRQILVGVLHSKVVVVGFNHHFGHNREGNYDYLYQLGQYYNFRVEEIPEQDIQNESVSSTKIRKAITEGNIQRANAYLDHYFNIIADLKEENQILNPINIKTYSVNIDDKEKLIPSDGVYAVSVEIASHTCKGMLLIVKDHVNEGSSLAKHFIELHILNEPENFRKNRVELTFKRRVRDNINIDNINELFTNTTSDRQLINELIY